MNPFLNVFPAVLLSAALTAQPQTHVYFVPSTTVPAATWCFGTPPGCCMDQISPRDVALVSKQTCQDCARKVAPIAAWNTLVGDADGDADYHDAALFESIDALLIKRDDPQSMRRMYVSPSASVNNTVSGGVGLRPGDVAAIVRDVAGNNGQLQYFLRAEHVRDAFGIAGPLALIDVDAIAQDDAGNVYLSLNIDKNVNVLVDGVVSARVLHDGGIGVIPATAITYNARGNVSAVTPNGGIVLLSEPAVDAMVAHANFQDQAFMCVAGLDNLTALEIDRNCAGTLSIPWGSATLTFPHLLFGGNTLVMGLLTTCGGGAIASLGTTPCPMGRSCGEPVASIGFEFGVLAPAALHALAIVDEPMPYHLVVDTCTPEFTGPGTLLLGAEYPAGPAAIALSVGPIAPGLAAQSLPSPWPTAEGFPELFGTTTLLHVFPVVGSTLSVTVPAGVTGNVLFQPLEVHPAYGVELGAPITVVLR